MPESPLLGRGRGEAPFNYVHHLRSKEDPQPQVPRNRLLPWCRRKDRRAHSGEAGQAHQQQHHRDADRLSRCAPRHERAHHRSPHRRPGGGARRPRPLPGDAPRQVVQCRDHGRRGVQTRGLHQGTPHRVPPRHPPQRGGTQGVQAEAHLV